MKMLSIICFIAVLYSCTYSLNVVHTEGPTTDLIDGQQRADPDIKTDLRVPTGLGA